MSENEIKILGQSIKVKNDFCDINGLKFFKENPRVYTSIYRIKGFDKLDQSMQQEKIFNVMRNESSVKSLIPDIKRNGGLMEHILVRHDTMEVIEGNSRLAAYKILYEKEKRDIWQFIPCNIVSSLDEDHQTAYLNQIHVKGKNQWSAYEKANIAFVNFKKGRSLQEIAQLLGEKELEIKKRIKTIQMMLDNKDRKKGNFSYYNVMVRNREISKAISENNDLKKKLLKEVKTNGRDSEFIASEMRDRLPTILRKQKILKKYIRGEINIDDAYQRTKTSKALEKMKKAIDILTDIESIKGLESNDVNSLEQEMRKLKRECERLSKLLKKHKC